MVLLTVNLKVMLERRRKKERERRDSTLSKVTVNVENVKIPRKIYN